VTYIYAPIFFWWLMPILTGLVLSAPIVRYSSSPSMGKWLRRQHVFLCPSETEDDPVLQDMERLLEQKTSPLPKPAIAPVLPPDNWTDMREQNLAQLP